VASASNFTHNTVAIPVAGPGSHDNVGGAIWVDRQATLIALKCLWADNQAREDGGALWVLTAGTAITLANCTFRNNRAGRSGGAIRVFETTQLFITDSTFVGNRARSAGGAITASTRPYVQLTRVDLYNNTADDMGGALVLSDFTTLEVVDCRMWGNTASCTGGGAAAILGSAVLNMTHSRVCNNTGGNVGGAVCAWTLGILRIHACDISGNAASSYGGALFLGDGSRGHVTDSTLAGNEVGRLTSCTEKFAQPFNPGWHSSNVTRCGGAILAGGQDAGGFVALSNTTIKDNTASYGGALCLLPAFSASSSAASVKVEAVNNTVFTGNFAPVGGDVYAGNVTKLSLPPGGSNLNSSSSSIYWPVECAVGSFLDPVAGTCVSCSAPTYLATASNAADPAQCQRCPEASECYGGAVLVAKPNFYHTNGIDWAGGAVPTCRLDNLTR
jgi:predicted outer membrane repeat protein